VVKVLTNPIFLRSAILLFCGGFAFLMGILFIRLLRKAIDDEADIATDPTPSLETLPLHLYNTVIQQLKQQKHELQLQNQAEQRRSRTTENFSQAVLSNLSSGVLVFGTNGLVQQSNPAAKKILGFASPGSMSAEDVFRGAMVSSADISAGIAFAPNAANERVTIADEVHCVLREDSGSRRVEADYTTPAGEERHIAVTVSPVPAIDGSLLGAACLINDLSEVEQIRHQEELRGEISNEMALELRSSLTTISEYARRLAQNRDAETKQLAEDIASEAARLDRTIVGFLKEKSGPVAQAAAGRA
jgi:nitrogen fixation/metabolism regulation signal transduction histidine kinase